MIDQLLHPSIIGDIKSHYDRTTPREAVGIIHKDLTVTHLVNESQRTMEFTVSPQQLASTFPDYNVFDTLYHTHVHSSASPSKGDYRFMMELHEHLPDIKHMIVAKDHLQIWEVRSTGPTCLGHFPI